jgi:TonB family protein
MSVRAGDGGRVGGGGGRASGGGEGEPSGTKPIAPAYALTEEPVFLDNVSAADIRRYYPEEARKAKVEGAVRMRLLVDDDGSVARASVLADPTSMFAHAAMKVARLYRFKPAKIDGRRVATEIEFTIHFELD